MWLLIANVRSEPAQLKLKESLKQYQHGQNFPFITRETKRDY